MNRQDAKRIIASFGILVFLWFSVFHLVGFGPLLQDPEFDKALERAEQIGIKDVEEIRKAPFRFLTRKEAVHRYVAMAQSADMLLYSDDICTFNDIDELDKQDYDMVMLACGYRFFWWAQGEFYPDEYVTKAMSLVALMKWFYPQRDFAAEKTRPVTGEFNDEYNNPYREPFVHQAYDLGITKRVSDEYMMYLIPKYELLLELYRAYKVKNWTMERLKN